MSIKLETSPFVLRFVDKFRNLSQNAPKKSANACHLGIVVCLSTAFVNDFPCFLILANALEMLVNICESFVNVCKCFESA